MFYIPKYFLIRKDSGPIQQPIWQGVRKTRKEYAFASSLVCLPLFILMAYMLTNSGENHPDGPAGSALVYLYRESIPILITILAIFGCSIYLFFTTLGRLRDINANPLWAFVYFLPGIVIPFSIFLLFMPGTKGPNKYGDDPRLKKTRSEKIIEKNQAIKETEEQLRSEHDVIKDNLKVREFCKVFKSPIKKDKGVSKIVFIGFDKAFSKYYIAIAKAGKTKENIEKQHFLSYQLMAKALYAQTGLLITEVAELNT